MTATLEREIKLRFADADSARAAIVSAGATPVRGRRLQEDCLLDTEDGRLRHDGCILRVRSESGKGVLTFKGPVQPSTLKVREELETLVGDGVLLVRILERLGFRVWFRYEKYREEFARDEVLIALDETPVGTFVEIEGSDRGIAEAAEALGRGHDEFVVDSYRRLYELHCEARGIAVTHMCFEDGSSL
jgi:adenylate cyclase class 2